jgi:predicted DCC family thiol-disulfide oxidoreductase YuxK
MNPHPRTESRPRQSPLLVYDGDCGFCTSSVRFIERHVKPRCTVTAWQRTDLDALGVTERRAQYEALWVTPAGTVHGGHRAVAKALLSAGRGWRILGALLLTPPVRWLAHGVYRLIADNRHRMPGGTAACSLAGERATAGPGTG